MRMTRGTLSVLMLALATTSGAAERDYHFDSRMSREVLENYLSYDAMLYPDGRRADQWSKGGSVPDLSQIETRLWFLSLAASYIELGVEAIHFGQVEIMNERDKDHVHWRELLRRVRAYAAQHARRRFVLCDAHVPGGGIASEGRLLPEGFNQEKTIRAIWAGH